MVPDQLETTLQFWIDALNNYDDRSLSIKPAPDAWSIGHVYMHLIEETTFFLAQARHCLSTEANATEAASGHGLAMLANNCFPNERIEGPPSNAWVPQAEGKEALQQGLLHLQTDIKQTRILLQQSVHKGKAKHPGLLYLDASQWCQFAEMHLRHHIRQKQRIDHYLASAGLLQNAQH